LFVEVENKDGQKKKVPAKGLDVPLNVFLM